jgi:amidase
MEGQETIPSVVGPMSHSPDALTLFTKTVAASQPWLFDPKCQPIPWRDDIFQSVTSDRKLKIGIMDWDGNILPQPPVRWAMEKLETKLKAAGHEIVPWRIHQKTALSILLRVFSSDASADIGKAYFHAKLLFFWWKTRAWELPQESFDRQTNHHGS